jgi:DUF1365 family protein
MIGQPMTGQPMTSAIYTGTLRHRRFKPVKHDFTYPLFMVFLDIDRIPELMQASRFTGYNRWNWASFHDRDHFGDPALPLRQRLSNDALRAGIPFPDGPVFLLTHLRYLGYNFNPISLFYCYDKTGELRTVMAEVNNTFGETKNYWLSEANRLASFGSQHYRCAKSMHVSPFMPMEMDYDFILTAPSDCLVAHMNTLDKGNVSFDATMILARQPWSAYALHRALRSHPWMTAKVITAIHWQALKLYLRKVPVFTHPARQNAPGVQK